MNSIILKVLGLLFYLTAMAWAGSTVSRPEPPPPPQPQYASWPESRSLYRGGHMGEFNVGREEMKVELNIFPTANAESGYESIIHLTKDNTDQEMKDGSRIPGIWFVPGSTQLHIAVNGRSGEKVNGAKFESTRSLPLNEWTKVTLHVKDKMASLYLNDQLDKQEPLMVDSWGGSRMRHVGTWHAHGTAQVYLGDPWYDPFKGSIKDVSLYSI